MCGRFTLSSPPESLAQLFELEEVPSLAPRYNIAPTQPVAVVRLSLEHEARRLDLLRWGLIPPWSKDPSIGSRMINARAETAAEKPAFRGAFRHRRCLIPADGFYEWAKEGSRKQPFFIQVTGDRPFALAGLWETWQPAGGEPVESCTILTTDANALLRSIHERMPVIIGPADYALWLDPTVVEPGRLQPLLTAYQAEAMSCFPVSPIVNSPANDSPECIAPLAS
jgi:putative SOS response-associated peptidase YedK